VSSCSSCPACWWRRLLLARRRDVRRLLAVAGRFGEPARLAGGKGHPSLRA
jgi:hypothetical protein